MSLALVFALIHWLAKKKKSETETGYFLPKREKMVHLEVATYEKDAPTVAHDSIA